MKYTYCLICKTTNNLTWHHVVPQCFTKHITEFKYTEKDIVCLCDKCHTKYHRVLKNQLSYTFSYFNLDLSKIHIDINLEAHEYIRSKISALRRDLPTNVRNKYITEIKLVFNDFTVDQITYYEKICKSKRVSFSAEKYLVDNVDNNDLHNYYRNHFSKYSNKRIKKLNKDI